MYMNSNTTTKLKSLLIEIWPIFYRIINGSVYFIFRVVRSSIKIAIQQIKDI